MFVVCSVVALQSIGTSAAQAPNPAPSGAVIVVMESPGGVRAANSLRAALRREGRVEILAAADMARTRVEPAAVLTVAAVASREVSVVYWDVSGRSDALSAPAPARADQLDAVVLALSSALLERHRPELLQVAQRASIRAEPGLARTTEELYAVLGHYNRTLPRTNVALRFEDF